uniref:Structural maintenance of chromosomes protein n=1 Tax=Parastrongyloides trichosuri TaxID=131310 RepID=A0A0N5A5C9_PARTI
MAKNNKANKPEEEYEPMDTFEMTRLPVEPINEIADISINTPDEEDELLNMEIGPPPEPCMCADGSGQRLVISSIIVENFKSYYGKQVIGPLHKNLSAIIGPNGSGKSNVIDSLLFVFGFRAANIRSKKISTLIHSSNGKNNISYCHVQINFEKIIDIDEERYNVVPNTSFSIGRYAYKDNSSKYTFNGTTRQYSDIKVLLKKEGIDLEHNRFLILQGEVELLALMPPKGKKVGETGMLEYLEDIIGCNRFKDPIEKLVYGIECLSKRKNLFMGRFKRIEEEKDELAVKARDCLNYIRAQNAQSFFANIKHYADAFKYAEKRDEVKEQRDKIHNDVKECEAKITEVTKLQDEEKSKYKDLQKEVDKLRKEGDKLKNKLEEEKNMEEKTASEVKRSETRLKELSKNIVKEKNKLENLQNVPDKCEEKINELKEELAKCDIVIEKKSVDVDESLIRFEAMSTEFAERLKEPEEEYNKLFLKETDANNDLTLAKENHKNLLAGTKSAEDELLRIRNLIKSNEEELSQIKRDRAQCQELLPKYKDELITKERECQKFVAERDRIYPIFIDLKGKKQQMEESMQSNQTQNKIVTALMRFKHIKKIKGIYGRLGDLGGIDEKYDYAITAACRNQLDFIVVDTTETAQICIEHLKENKLGRASMLILNEQIKRFSKHLGPIKVPENSQRLFDLVQCDDNDIRCAFYFALRDTLVCDDINTARNVGLGGKTRWRTVSLKGEIVEVSGVMTGGGSKLEGGKMGKKALVTSSSENEEGAFEIIKKQLDETEIKFNKLEKDIGELNVKISNLRKEIDTLTEKDSKFKPLIEHKKIAIAQFKAQEKDRAVEVTAKQVDESTILESVNKIEQLQRVFEKCQTRAAKARAVVDAINSEKDGLYEKIVGIHEQPLIEARKEKAEIEKSIKSENTKASNAKLNAKKSERNIAKLEGEIIELEEKIKSSKEYLDKNFKVVFKLQQDIEENGKAEKEALEAFQEKNGHAKELNDRQVELTRQLNELNTAFEVKDGEYLQLKQTIKTIKKKIAALKTTDISTMTNISQAANADEDKGDFLFEINGRSVDGGNVGDVTFIGGQMEGLAECMITGKLIEYSYEDFENINMGDVELKAKMVDVRLGQLKAKKITLRVLEDFKEAVEKYEKENAILIKMNDKLKKYNLLMEKYRTKRLIEFLDGYTQIMRNLKLIYQMLTLGGEANLQFVNSRDPFEKGIRFSVRPPYKTWREMSRLSGGEKTLSSLALVFALHRYRPTPLYVMDEIDAALDFRNVTIIAHFVKQQTKNAQFIIITLRNNMFELADRIIGICKQNDCTENVVIDPGVISIH